MVGAVRSVDRGRGGGSSPWCSGSGHAEEAERAVERGGRLAEELNYPPSVVFHLSLRNELRLWQGDAPKLRESAERMLRLANSEGFELFASTAYVYRGLARASLGDRTDGIDEARLGWEAYAATGAGLNIVQEHCRRAEALAAASRPDEALALLDEAEQRVRDHGEKNCDAEVHRVRAEIWAAAGRRQEAMESARRAIEVARSQGAQALVQRAEATLGRISRDRSSAAHDPDLEPPPTEQSGRA